MLTIYTGPQDCNSADYNGLRDNYADYIHRAIRLTMQTKAGHRTIYVDYIHRATRLTMQTKAGHRTMLTIYTGPHD